MAYTHGVYGTIIPSRASFPPSGVGTLPVYIGTAPVNTLVNPSTRVNVPFKVNSFDEAVAAVGYSDDWNTFTLCEAIYAHFKNPTQNIGPIVLINVFDPASDFKAGTASITLTNKVGYIDNDKVLLASCAVTGKVLGTDFAVEYVEVDGRVKVKFTDLTSGGIASPVSITFNEMDASKVIGTDIVGGMNPTTGVRTGISVVDLVYQEFGMVPTILAAPGWSHKPDVYAGLVAKCQNINGHWDAVCVVDMDSTAAGAKTIAAAKTWKVTNAYTSKYAKACWPKAKYAGKTFWLSTLTTVAMQQVDFNNNSIPYETPSNKAIMANGTILADNTAISFDEQQATDLNSEGITTLAYIGGQWRLWGPHMGNYTYAAEDSIKPEDLFDASVRTLQYIKNSFQKNYVAAVDKPFSRRQIETILDEAQVWLNGLVSEGAILYGKISFNAQSNPSGQVARGNFIFDIRATTTPPGKSITFQIQYDAAGLTTLTE